MTDPSDAIDGVDVELARILTACRDGDHALNEVESRTLAAAYAQQDTSLQHWGAGIDVAHTTRLIEDTQWLLDAAGILREDADPHRYPDEARNALCALLDYFRSRARVRPTRADYERELTQLYATEIEFLRAHGHTPSIAWAVDGSAVTGVAACLEDAHQLLATNGDGFLAGSETGASPGHWSISIYEHDTGHTVANAVDACFATAYAQAIAALTRPPDPAHHSVFRSLPPQSPPRKKPSR
ncbi:hypothetical protein AB0346_00475 [Nocardia beijingensis]|uniref:hypothetical protein n=1 Tax=Nocardia beijingensis TaxID=95162 RepID=UPI00344E7613